MRKLSDEEVASRIVNIYFENVARTGFKRSLDLDAVINSYLYSLSMLGKKDSELEKIRESVRKMEAELITETKEEILPQAKI